MNVKCLMRFDCCLEENIKVVLFCRDNSIFSTVIRFEFIPNQNWLFILCTKYQKFSYRICWLLHEKNFIHTIVYLGEFFADRPFIFIWIDLAAYISDIAKGKQDIRRKILF